MTALSEEPGTWFGLQLAATLQLPPAVFVQLIVAASATMLPTAASNKTAIIVFIEGVAKAEV